MLGQTPDNFWSLEPGRQLVSGNRYLFLIATPNAWTEDQAEAILTAAGWNVVSFNAAPPEYQAAVQNIANSSLPAPHVSMILGVWNGTTSTLPTSSGDLYFGPIYAETKAVAGPDDTTTDVQITQNANGSSGGIALLGLAAGGLIVLGISWAARRRRESRAT
jgi:hypothetical protein